MKQNFVKPNSWKLDDIPKIITTNSKNYYLRGVIIFHGRGRSGLKSATGHYTAGTYRGNQKWEIYDDIKSKVTYQASSTKLTLNY